MLSSKSASFPASGGGGWTPRRTPLVAGHLAGRSGEHAGTSDALGALSDGLRFDAPFLALPRSGGRSEALSDWLSPLSASGTVA